MKRDISNSQEMHKDIKEKKCCDNSKFAEIRRKFCCRKFQKRIVATFQNSLKQEDDADDETDSSVELSDEMVAKRRDASKTSISLKTRTSI